MNVRLVPATVELIDAESAAPERLAAALEAELPPDWPPEHHDEGTLAWTREQLGDPANAGWLMHYVLWTGDDRPTLAGICGYTGAPVDGTTEIGYSVVPSMQRRGIATEATRQLVASGRARGAERLTAKTLAGHEPSLGVLRKLGFVEVDPPEPGVVEYALRL